MRLSECKGQTYLNYAEREHLRQSKKTINENPQNRSIRVVLLHFIFID